jgi:hypothetical protein
MYHNTVWAILGHQDGVYDPQIIQITGGGDAQVAPTKDQAWERAKERFPNTKFVDVTVTKTHIED